MSRTYKGLIFNSTTVRALKGALAEAVHEHRIRTAVVSNHNRTEVGGLLESAGLTVDVVVGGFDLNRFGNHRKPDPDLLFIAAAKMGLPNSDILVVEDCGRDRRAASGAGMDTIAYDPDGMDSLISLLGDNPPEEPGRDLSGFEAPLNGIMGLIVGDTVGSCYESSKTATKDFNFPLFPSGSHPTDDSICSLAIARWLLGERTTEKLIGSMVQLCNSYPRAGYSHSFKHWLRSLAHAPYGGNTNGSAMRVAPCGWASQSLEEALELARQTASISHDSPEGIRGAQAVASAVYMARTGHAKEEIGRWVETRLGYDFSPTVEEIRRTADRSYTCEVSIPQAFCCWLQSGSYEEAVRNAVSLGTDADTIAAICGALCAATPGMEIPRGWAEKVLSKLDPVLKGILADFDGKFCRR